MEAAPAPFLIVTTRSRLKSARFFPAMLIATRQIRRQLAGTEGLARWASIVAGPTEFWTITVWRSRHAMQEFMRSGAHGDLMWSFSRWLDSFWLMRWRSGPVERGSWEGLVLGPGHAPDADDPVPRDGAATGAAVAREVFKEIPSLRDALAPSGGVAYDSAPLLRRKRAQLEGAGGAVVRIRVPPAHTLPALAHVVRERHRLTAGPGALGAAAGAGQRGEVYLLAAWSDHRMAADFLEGPWVAAARARWGDRCWAQEWLPENEFGHWDGRRLRTVRRRAGTAVSS